MCHGSLECQVLLLPSCFPLFDLAVSCRTSHFIRKDTARTQVKHNMCFCVWCYVKHIMCFCVWCRMCHGSLEYQVLLLPRQLPLFDLPVSCRTSHFIRKDTTRTQVKHNMCFCVWCYMWHGSLEYQVLLLLRQLPLFYWGGLLPYLSLHLLSVLC